MPNTANSLALSSPVYDKGKFLVQILFPAISTLYFVLSGIWDLPYTEQVMGTIAAISIFLGSVLRISSNAYSPGDPSGSSSYKGKYVGSLTHAVDAKGKTIYSLELDVDPEDLANQEVVAFKVKPS
jgi:Putative phage holin Dp-1